MKALLAAGKKGRSGSPQLPNEGSVDDDDDIGGGDDDCGDDD